MRKHLEKVVATSVGRLIAENHPNLEHWLQLLPVHHSHPNSHLPLEEAKIRLMSPHYYSETVLNDMINMAKDLQREKLELLKVVLKDDAEFSKDLVVIYKELTNTETPEEKTIRIAAEQRVRQRVLEHGERIGHKGSLFVPKPQF